MISEDVVSKLVKDAPLYAGVLYMNLYWKQNSIDRGMSKLEWHISKFDFCNDISPKYESCNDINPINPKVKGMD
jgi:hypothetical protein